MALTHIQWHAVSGSPAPASAHPATSKRLFKQHQNSQALSNSCGMNQLSGLCPARCSLIPRRHLTTHRHKLCCNNHSQTPGHGTDTYIDSIPSSNLSASIAPGEGRSVWIFGVGYTTLALGNVLKAAGWCVSGTCRSPRMLAHVQGSKQAWAVHPYDPAKGVRLSTAAQDELQAAHAIISSIPPLALPLYDPVLYDQLQLLRNHCQAPWVGYLSSTGVYGDHGGAWVDESARCNPVSTRGYVRLEHETAWRRAQQEEGLPLHVLRLGGIYGPTRNVLTSLSRSSDASSSQTRRGQQRYTSRCHVADIVTAVAASIQRPRSGAVYNVVDDEPAPRHEVEAFALRLLADVTAVDQTLELHTGRSQPKEHGVMTGNRGRAADNAKVDVGTSGAGAETPSTDSASRSSGDSKQGVAQNGGSAGVGRSSRRSAEPLEEKRVRNDLIKQELGVQLQFPTYREGMATLHAQQIAPFLHEDLLFMQGGCVRTNSE